MIRVPVVQQGTVKGQHTTRLPEHRALVLLIFSPDVREDVPLVDGDEVPEPDPAPQADERQEVVQTCERIAGKLGSVSLADCTESKLRLSGARSNQGTPILVAEANSK